MIPLVPATDGTSLALTSTEFGRLVELEKVIEKGLRTFIEVGTALLEIKDRRLYRERFETFEVYCHSKWGFGAHRAYQLIDASIVAQDLSTMVDNPPTSERQVRPLVGLESDQRKEAWSLAVERTGGHPTSKTVQKASDEIRARDDQLVVRTEPAVPAASGTSSDEDDEVDDGITRRADLWHLKTLEKMRPCEQAVLLFAHFDDSIKMLGRLFRLVEYQNLVENWSDDTIEETITTICVAGNTLLDIKMSLEKTLVRRSRPHP